MLAGKEYPLNKIAYKTNIDIRTIYSYSTGASLPNLMKFYLICQAIGADFKNEFEAILGFHGSIETDSNQVSSRQILTNLCEETAQLARHLEDGHIDHIEIKDHIESMTKLQQVISGYMSNIQKQQTFN